MSAPTGLLFVDSFDHYTTLGEMQRKWTAAGLKAFVTGRSGSGQALEIGASFSLPYLTFGWTYPTICCGVAYNTNSFSSYLLQFQCSGNTLQLSHVGDGRLQLTINLFTVEVGPFLGFVMNINTWYYFELKIAITSGLYTYEVRANNSTIASGSFSASTGSPLGMQGVTLGGPGGGSFATVDDLYITDGTFLGDANWVPIYPNAPGDATTWTPNPAVANWINVSEHSPDDFTSYNEADAISNQDLYNMDNVGSATIVGAHALNCVTKSAAGVASFEGSIKTNTTLVQEPEFFPSFGSWIYQRFGYEINPVTGVAWTAADINAIQRGALRIS